MYIHHYIFTVPVNKIARSDHVSKQGLKAFQNEIRNLIAISQEHKIIPILTTFTWNKDFPKDVGGNQLFIPLMNLQNEIIRKVSDNKKIPLADIDRFFPHEDGLFIDDVHLSQQGNEYLARIIFDTFVKSKIIEKLKAN